jgi:hypothetical protein
MMFGPADDPGLGNFTAPLVGYWEKLVFSWRDLLGPESGALQWATLATVIALAVQASFFLLRWRPAERWWRVGTAFAVMMLFLSTPVWEGFPGASTRVLLPMTLGFNVLLPRGKRWLPLLIAGNLTVAAGIFEYSPPHEFYTVRGDAALRSALQVVPTNGWHGPEHHLEKRWRWNSGRGELRLINKSTASMRVVLIAQVRAASPRAVRVSEGEKLVWGETVGAVFAQMRFGLVLPPGQTTLVFSSDRPGEKVGTDPRLLAFRVENLEIVVAPVGVSR